MLWRKIVIAVVKDSNFGQEMSAGGVTVWYDFFYSENQAKLFISVISKNSSDPEQCGKGAGERASWWVILFFKPVLRLSGFTRTSI